jgi:nucleotide-binding universal stress UspA family protein
LFEGKAAEKIIEFARQENVDLIALSSHGQSGINEWNISSVVQKIILQSQKSILLIRAYQAMSAGIHEVAYQKLAIPLDCSQRAELALPLAVNIAKFFNAEIILAHVTREPELICRHPPSEEELDLVRQLTECNRNYVEKYFEQLTSQLTSQGVAVQACLQTSKIVTESMHALVEEQKIELMLMTAHGATGSHKWPYGNLSTSFIIYGSTPIIILQDLKPGEFEASLAEVVAREYKGH